MTTPATVRPASPLRLLSLAPPPTLLWANPYGGPWGLAANWMNTTAGAIATTPPDATNPVTINGGTNNNFIDIVGTGAAAQLAINGDVLLWGTIAVAGSVTLGPSADLDLDGSASLAAGSLNLLNSASLEAGGTSTITLAGTATLAGGFLAAVDGSTVQLGMLIANSINLGYPLATGTIAVDDDSSIEVGTAGGAAPGAITIDSGVSTAISGAIEGNLVVNGTVGIQAAGTLAIDTRDLFGTPQAITGSGTLTISENSLLTLGIADSAAIRFGGPDGTLALWALPTGLISGFAAGDIIEIIGGKTAQATGLTYTQTSNSVATLTFRKGGAPAGILTFAGNYAGSLFHLGFDTAGDGIITLQTPGSAPVQPGLILGTAGYDNLTATANNQTLTGLGGNDTLSTAGFAGIDFQDTSADLNGSSITSFGSSDVIDLTDMNLATATLSYTASPASITVTDATHTATIGLSFGIGPSIGTFAVSTDGQSGTDVRFVLANTDAYSFATVPGGHYSTAAKWQDITTGTTATAVPGYGNGVTLAGGAAYINLTGTGVAASIATSRDVLLWGSIVVGTQLTGVSGALTQTGTLAMDGAADLVLAGTASIGGLLEIGGGSTLTAAGLSFASSGASLLAIDGSSAQFPALLGANGSPGGSQYDPSVLAVDATSSIEFGSAGHAVAGALTIDSGIIANLGGTIDGKIVLNGTLAVAGTLSIAPFGSVAPTVSGSGMITLTYGDTLSLAGPDSVPILFSQTALGSYSSTTETLALATSLPTATITGFAKGDVITVGLVVTSLTWNGARLSLLDGGVTVGSLLLAGTYASGQFQVQPTANGLSAITYTATPSTVGGNSVSGTSDSYLWTSISGGVWSNAGNWTDTTTGGAPSGAPGASNTVIINDTTGPWTAQLIYGPAAAASLTIASAADTILTGVMAVTGLFSVNDYGTASGDAAIDSQANLTAGSLNVTSLFRVARASLLTVLGSSTGTFISGQLAVSGDSAVRVAAGTSVITGTVAVDPSSSVEFGTAGTATAGSLAIDYGQAPTLQGVATIEANVALNGNLLVYSGTIEGFGGSVGSIAGNGTITIGALNGIGSLVLHASDTSAIVFQGYSVNFVPYAFESLELQGPLRTGIIYGFIAGDTIVVDHNVTGVSFTQTTGSQGTLTLTNGATIVGTLTLNGNYTTGLFQVDMAPATGVTAISLQDATSTAGTDPAGTNSHTYSWTGASGASWATAANWQDTTTASVPATVPGSGNVVVIAGNIAANQYTTIGGNGAAVDLTVTGNVLLTGQVAVAGSVHVSTGSGPAAALALEAGASLTAGGSAEVFGRLELGGGSSATLPGYALLFGGSLLALSGSTLQAGGLIGDSAGDVLAVDSSSAVRIGTSAATAAGALTIAAGAPAEFSGLIYGSLVDNGQLWVSGGGTLFIDLNGTAEADPYSSAPTINGSGILLLTEGSTLGLGVADSVPIQFVGPNAALVLAALPSATITGFAAGDQIQVDQAVTGLAFHQVVPGSATLTLTNGASTVGVLNLAGTYSGNNNAFHLDVAPGGSTAVITLQSLLTTPAQMTLIQGTYGADQLIATANGQTMTGNGGGDILSGGTFAAVDFKDYSFYLNGSAIQDFAVSDIIDFIDVNPTNATATYTGGILSITDGAHSAVLGLSFATTPTSGSFHTASDGASGTRLTWS